MHTHTHKRERERERLLLGIFACNSLILYIHANSMMLSYLSSLCSTLPFPSRQFSNLFYLLQVRAKLKEMGALAPMNIFLRQEIDRMQRVIATVRSTLRDLQLAIDGTIIMSEVCVCAYMYVCS